MCSVMTTVTRSPGEVRQAGPEEWQAIAALTTEVYGDLAPESPPPSWTDYLGSVGETLTRPDDARRLVVEVAGRIVASALLCPPSAGRAGEAGNPHPELRLLSVHPDCRNQGWAGRLIEACERQVLADGYDAITLHTTSLMPTAKAMYERRGYVRAPELDFEPSPGFVVWGYRCPLG